MRRDAALSTADSSGSASGTPQLSLRAAPTGTRWFVSEFKLYRKHAALCVMLLPVIAYFIIFRYIPMGGLMIAFKNYKLGLGILKSPWNGTANFKQAFSTVTFRRAFGNTLYISLYKLGFGFPMPIILAVFLNEIRHMRFKRTVQTISYLPHFLSWIIVAGIFRNILSPNTGMVNYVLVNWFGLAKPIYFLGTNNTFRSTLVVTEIWKGVGWGSILYLATISSIDPALYESAMCDGATRFQRILYITLPHLAPTITILLILNIGGILDAGFDQIFNMYNSAVYATGDIIDTYVYRYGLGEMKYAFGTAVGLFKNAIGFMLVIGTNTLAKRISEFGLW